MPKINKSDVKVSQVPPTYKWDEEPGFLATPQKQVITPPLGTITEQDLEKSET